MRLIDYFRQINLLDWGLGLGSLMDITIAYFECIKQVMNASYEDAFQLIK